MDDDFLRKLVLGNTEDYEINPAEIGKQLDLSEEEVASIRPLLDRRGRPYFGNVFRDIRINVAVEKLQRKEEGEYSFRGACKRAAPIVNKSPASIISICQKVRKRKEVYEQIRFGIVHTDDLFNLH